MNRNWTKRGVLLGILFVPTLVLTIYFEVGNFMCENQIKEMSAPQEYTIQVESSIEHKTLKREGYEIHYYVSGKETNELIMFLHPAFSDHRAFDQQIDYFAKNYSVISIDFIGHASKANASKDKINESSTHLAEIMEREGFDEAHLVGVSMGGLIAQYFALTHPEKTKSLTALGAYSIHKENKEVAKAQRSSNLSLIFRALFSMKSFRKKTAKITCKTEKGQVLFYKASSQYQRKSFLIMQGLQQVIKDRKNGNPSCPTLILTGEFDIDLAQKMAKEWHSEIENAGHCANMDQPDVFNKVVAAFIKEND